MARLALDTAGANCSLALSLLREGQSRVYARQAVRGRGQSDRIVPEAEALLCEAGLAFSDLSDIICTYGPGSFTGVRVGLAFAKGLALASDAVLKGVSNFHALAEGYIQDKSFAPGNFSTVIDAGRGGLYVQAFSAKPERYDDLTNPSLIEASSLKAYVLEHQLTRIVAPMFQSELFLKIMPEKIFSGEEAVGEALLLVEAGAEKLLTIDERHSIKGADVKALYLRAADAKPQQGKALQHA